MTEKINKYQEKAFKKESSDLRKKRVEPVISAGIGEFLLNDPVLSLMKIFITKVDISKDLQSCKVFFRISDTLLLRDKNTHIENAESKNSEQLSVLQKNIKIFLKVLKLNAPKIAAHLFKSLHFKRPIYLSFFYDDSVEKIEAISRAIDNSKKN
jgi:ribosome-binding factor A